MILGVDVSVWNTNLDWATLYAGGVRFAVVKISQGVYIRDKRAVEHIAAARAAGMIVAGYMWTDPMMDDNNQADLAIIVAKELGLKCVMIDVEQYWKYWSEFAARNVVNYIDPSRITQCARNVTKRIRAAGLQTRYYTRGSFITSYSPGLWYDLRIEGNWFASYPYKEGRVAASWSDITNGQYTPTSNPWIKKDESIPWIIWQFSGDKFILPGTGGSPIDLNFYHGSIETITALFGGIIALPPTPPPSGEDPEVKLVITRKVAIRTTPSTSLPEKGYRNIGEVITVKSMKINNSVSVWVQDERGWSAVIHYGVVYMKEGG